MAVAFVLFAGAIGAGFAWDDELLFSSWLRYLDGPRAILSPPSAIPQFTEQYFRPLVLASYVIDEQLATTFFSPEAREQGRRVFFHLSPVLLHVVCTGLVFLLGLRLLRRSPVHADHSPWTAFAAALLFAAHPIHVESVAWIAGRSDSLCALFGLSSLLAFLDWREHRRLRALVLTGSLLFLALLCKETALGLLLPGLVIAGAWGDRSTGRSSRETYAPESVCVVSALAGYALLRAVFGADGSTLATLSGSGASLTRLPGAAGWSVARMLWPFPQTVFPPADLGGALAVTGLAAAAGAAALFVVWRGRTWRSERFALTLVAGGLAVPLAVAATSLSTSPVAERYLYLPSVGICLLFATLVARVPRFAPFAARTRLPLVVVLCGALALPLGWITSERLGLWDDPVRFWRSAASTAPASAVVFINLGQVLADDGRPDEARVAFRRAADLATLPDQSAVAHTNLGSLEMTQGRLDVAMVEFTRALERDPRHTTALFNQASVLAMKGRHDEAMRNLNAALSLHPRYAKAHLLLGTLLLEAGRQEKARESLRAAARIDPSSPEARRARELLSAMSDSGR
jgi:Tfp pilus assembly protein PilF